MVQPLFFEDRQGSFPDPERSTPDETQPGHAAKAASTAGKRKRRSSDEPAPHTPPAEGDRHNEQHPERTSVAPPQSPAASDHDEGADEEAPGSDSDCPSERGNDFDAVHDAAVEVFGARVSTARGPRAKSVWVDEDDDDDDDARGAQMPLVNLHKVKRRRKLRAAVGETHVSAGEYEARLRDMFRTGAGGANVHAAGAKGGWARLPSERDREEGEEGELSDGAEESDGEDDAIRDRGVHALLQTTSRVLKSRRRATAGGVVDQEAPPLRPGVLNLRRVANANADDPNKAEARCVEFHPSGRLLLTAGLDKTLRIFQVDGVRNPKVQGLHLRNFPIHTAKFTGGGSQVILAGRRRFFHTLDMDSGRVMTMHTLSTHPERAWERFEVSPDGSKLAFLGQQGKIVLMSNKSKREIGQLRLNSRVACVAFAAEGANENHVYAASRDGTVYLWDIRRMDCIDRHKDEGAVHSTCLATSAAHYALGSDSGVVNVYSSSAMRATREAPVFGMRTEKPRKTFLNLTTSIDNVTFNGDGKLLAFSSHEKKNAVKIVHVPTMTVYANWPTAKANMRRACSLRFSPQSGYFAVGNDKGDVHLMRLASYPAA